MFFPVSHENMKGRRLPWVTIGLIALNTVIFLLTNGTLEREDIQIHRVEADILVLSAQYPDVRMSPEAKDVVTAIEVEYPEEYRKLVKKYQDDADEALRAGRDPERLSALEADARMAQLCAQFKDMQDHSIAWNYEFHAVDPRPWSYITANFLHGGWLHLIFNMWFLWLAGPVLEDAWGRIVYPVFYLVAGVLAWAVHGVVFPHSLVPALGASGAIAGLMGAFLARFPKTKIRLGLFYVVYRFNVAAYIILPMWLAVQVLYGVLSRSLNSTAGVAYWAHIGGFAFGALGALLLHYTGVEHSANQAIEAKVGWSADPRIVRATDSLGENNPAGAIYALRELVKEKPDSLDGWELLLTAQHQKQDAEGEKETLAALIRLKVASADAEGAWSNYVEFRNLGGEKLPRGVWLELCRHLECQKSWDIAAEEYERLAEANVGERAGVAALVAAARINLEHRFKPDRAEMLFKEAAESPAPHSDLDPAIQDGLKKCAASVYKPYGS